jgi:hypothetical protein
VSGLLTPRPIDGLLPDQEGLLGPSFGNPLIARQVATQRAAYPRQQLTTPQQALDLGAGITSMVPGLGDAMGLAADLNRYRVEPESRTLPNFGLSALGLLPFVPPMSTITKRHLPMPDKLFPAPAPSKAVLDASGRVESVPISKVRATESPLERSKGRPDRGPLIEGYADKPVAARLSDGTYMLYDGHHRTEAALNRGDGALEMYVVDVKKYAPSADQKPSKFSKEDADLLEQLLSK